MRDLTRLMVAVSLFASDPVRDVQSLPEDMYEIDPDDPVFRDEFKFWVLWTSADQAAIGVVEQLSRLIGLSGNLSAQEAEIGLSVRFFDEELFVPLWPSVQSPYPLVSSLARILRDSHDFWTLPYMTDADSHPFLVTTKQETTEIRTAHAKIYASYLESFQPGRDPYTGIEVPYIGHETANPAFERQYQAIDPILRQIREAEAQAQKDLMSAAATAKRVQHQLAADFQSGLISESDISKAAKQHAKRVHRIKVERSGKLGILRNQMLRTTRTTG
ncbi:MAG: hypothetical protein AAF408_09470 [Pseudomonadota bacterium]